MEELQEFCQAGMPVTLSSSWEEFSTAKQLLASHGYTQVTEEAGGSAFVKQGTPQCVQQIPLATPAWKEHSPFTGILLSISTRSIAAADAEWKACPCFQLDTAKLPPHNQVRIQAQIPKLSFNKQQSVGIKLLIQPFAKLDEAQLYIKLRIATLVVGVPKTEFLTDKFSLGYYPDFISLTIEPELADSSVAIPIYIEEEGRHEAIPRAPSAIVKESSDTSIGVEVGFGPASITLQHNREQEWESSREKQRLIAVEADGNAAGFEWSILRWDDGNEYVAECPHSGLGFLFGKEPKLPFAGTSTAARLGSFPDAIWHLKRDLKDKPLKFGLCLQVQMQLLWFLGTTNFFRSTGSVATAFQFRNHFSIELPRSMQES